MCFLILFNYGDIEILKYLLNLIFLFEYFLKNIFLKTSQLIIY